MYLCIFTLHYITLHYITFNSCRRNSCEPCGGGTHGGQRLPTWSSLDGDHRDEPCDPCELYDHRDAFSSSYEQIDTPCRNANGNIARRSCPCKPCAYAPLLQPIYGSICHLCGGDLHGACQNTYLHNHRTLSYLNITKENNFFLIKFKKN